MINLLKNDNTTTKSKTKTLEGIYDMDWRKQNSKGYPDIPKGETVEILEEGIDNVYGYGLVKIKWKGNTYLTKPDYLEF